jgi:hypothetical protein
MLLRNFWGEVLEKNGATRISRLPRLRCRRRWRHGFEKEANEGNEGSIPNTDVAGADLTDRNPEALKERSIRNSEAGVNAPGYYSEI